MKTFKSTEFVLVSLIFQVIWLIAVLGQSRWQTWLWIFLLMAALWLWRQRREVWLAGRRVLAMGLLIDGLNLVFGVLIFQTTGFPGWLAALWLGFACYCGYLVQMAVKWPVGIVVLGGATGGMLSYFAGMQLGAVEFGYALPVVLGVLWLEWGLITYAALKLYASQAGNLCADNSH